MSTKPTPGSEPAFPHQFKLHHSSGGSNIVEQLTSGGLTKREYFAGQALIGLLMDSDVADVAKASVRHADALIAELAKEVK